MGADHDFLIPGDIGSFLEVFLKRLQNRWPRITVSDSNRYIIPLGSFPELLTGPIDMASDPETAERTWNYGIIAEVGGAASFLLWPMEKVGSSTHLDVIAPYFFPHPAVKHIFIELFAALSAIYEVPEPPSWMSQLRTSGRHLYYEVPIFSPWLAEAILFCIQRRDALQGISFANTGGENSDISCRVLCVPEMMPEPALSFISRNDESGQPLTIIETRPAVERQSQLFSLIQESLHEAISLWHYISYRDMTSQIAFACPPGTPMICDGRIEFEGNGKLFPMKTIKDI